VIGIDKTNTFQFTFLSSMKTVGAAVLGGLRQSKGVDENITFQLKFLF